MPDDKPIADIHTLPLTAFLPDCDDNRLLREEWMTLMGRVITKYMAAFEQYQQYVQQHIPHEYSHITKKKTKVVSVA